MRARGATRHHLFFNSSPFLSFYLSLVHFILHVTYFSNMEILSLCSFSFPSLFFSISSLFFSRFFLVLFHFLGMWFIRIPKFFQWLKLIINHSNNTKGWLQLANFGRMVYTTDTSCRTWLEEEPNLTLADMRDKLLSDHDINVSVWTISRRLKDHGIKLRSKTPVPKLTQNHKSIRVNWCQNYLNHNWSMTVFSDESYFYLERNKVKRWSRYTVRIPSNVKSSGIMVWGAISQNGRLAIKVDTGSLNAQNYINVLTTALIPAANVAFGNESWFFQQDNVPAHSAVVTQNFFAQNNIQVIQWPAKSPDLNIIEHIWAFMKNKVERREPKTIQELKNFILNCWNEITPQFINNLYSSIPQRLQACIQRGGDTIDTSGVIN